MWTKKHECTIKHALYPEVSKAIINAHQHCTERTRGMLARAERKAKIRKPIFKVVKYTQRER